MIITSNVFYNVAQITKNQTIFGGMGKKLVHVCTVLNDYIIRAHFNRVLGLIVVWLESIGSQEYLLTLKSNFF